MKPASYAVTTTYSFSKDDLKEILATHLGCNINHISIQAREVVVSSDPLDRYPTVYGFGGLEVTVKA